MAEETTEAKRPRRLNKEITEDGIVKIEVIGGTKGVMEFNHKDLPEVTSEKLPPFAVSHKLGDSAAGKAGVEAEEAITKVWEGMMAGDWSVRAPATPKVSVKALVDKMQSLPEEAQAQARQLLESLGVSIPDASA